MPRVGALGWKKFTGGQLSTIMWYPSLNPYNTLIFKSKALTDSNYRFNIYGHGYMSWGSGGASEDVAFYRTSSGLLRCTALLVGASLGVGNSAAGNTLGNLVKQVEIFDEAGDSLGYIPIYDAITQV